jgi:hypothetical protein
MANAKCQDENQIITTGVLPDARKQCDFHRKRYKLRLLDRDFWLSRARCGVLKVVVLPDLPLPDKEFETWLGTLK